MMKKQIALAFIAATLLSVAGLAEAGGSNRGHGGGYQSRGHHGNGGHYYGRPYGYGGYGHRGGHYNYYNPLAVVAGAVVLGSVIYGVTHQNRREVVYRTQRVESRPEYWYRVDADGQCVEVRLNSAGNEVWTDVDPAYCN